jgi:hypothetical protein
MLHYKIIDAKQTTVFTDTFKPVQQNTDSQCQQTVTTVFNVNNAQGD